MRCPGKADNRTDNLRWLALGAAVAALLLFAQAGLAYHGASHIHAAGESEDCSLCVLGSHFVSEPASAQGLGVALTGDLLSPEITTANVVAVLPVSLARGPPPASV